MAFESSNLSGKMGATGRAGGIGAYHSPNVVQPEESKTDPDMIEEIAMTEELEDVFHDANDYFPAESILMSMGSQPAQRHTYRQTYRQTVQPQVEEIKDFEMVPNPDPAERDVLPYFKDPKVKISIWTILKDSIGKDISKLSVPVYFNDPLNILQKCCNSQEYNDLLDLAVAEQDPIRRLAIVSIFSVTLLTTVERSSTKPFNPLLGETYEYVCPKFRFLAE
jgi:hypothetical protein